MTNERKKYVGTLVNWNEKGYGFVFNKEIGRRVFFHATAFNRETDPCKEEEKVLAVEFELAPGRREGQPDVAVNVTPITPTAGLDALKPSETAVAL